MEILRSPDLLNQKLHLSLGIIDLENWREEHMEKCRSRKSTVGNEATIFFGRTKLEKPKFIFKLLPFIHPAYVVGIVYVLGTV